MKYSTLGLVILVGLGIIGLLSEASRPFGEIMERRLWFNIYGAALTATLLTTTFLAVSGN